MIEVIHPPQPLPLSPVVAAESVTGTTNLNAMDLSTTHHHKKDLKQKLIGGIDEMDDNGTSAKKWWKLQSTTTSARRRDILSFIEQNSNLLNVIVLGISFCTFFTAFNTMQGFLTDLKKEQGFYALSVLYMFFAISVPIVPAAIELFGAKALLFVSSLTYSAFVLLAIFEPVWPLMVASAVNGIGGAVLWTAHGSFLVQIGGDKLGFYTGLFFAIFTINMLVGNLLAGVLLSAGASVFLTFFILFIISVIGNMMLLFLRSPKSAVVAATATESTNHNEEQDTELVEQTTEDTGVIEEGHTIVMDDQHGVEPLEPAVKQKKSLRTIVSDIGRGVRNTFKVMIDKRMILFMGIALHNGFTISLFFGAIPSTIGEKSRSLIGYCMSAFGVSEILGSILFGKLLDTLGKRKVMTTTLVLQVCATVLIWFMSYSPPYLFFVTTFVCGLADSGYNTSIYSILGSPAYFQDRAGDGIAAFKFLQSVAIGCGFVLSRFVSRVTLKIVLSVLLGFAIVTWTALEYFVASADKKEIASTELVARARPEVVIEE